MSRFARVHEVECGLRQGLAKEIHINTAPPLGHADRVELPHRVRIAELLEERETGSLELLGSLLAERVLDHPQADDTCAGARGDSAS